MAGVATTSRDLIVGDGLKRNGRETKFVTSAG
jgi:hypothetical protein